jgi:hypothetical protein
LFGDRDEEEVEHVEDQDQADDMSARIRRDVAAGSPLSQAVGRRLREAMDAGPPDEPSESEEANRAIAAGRSRSRVRRGLPSELPEPEAAADVSTAIRSAVARRGASMDRGFRERLFGDDENEAGDAGGKE